MAFSSASSRANDQAAVSFVEYGFHLAAAIIATAMDDLQATPTKESGNTTEDDSTEANVGQKVSLQSDALGNVLEGEVGDNSTDHVKTDENCDVNGTDVVDSAPVIHPKADIPKIEFTSDTEDNISSSEDEAAAREKRGTDKEGENGGESNQKGDKVTGFGFGFTRHSTGFNKQAQENEKMRKKCDDLEERLEAMTKRNRDMEEQGTNDKKTIQELTDMVEKLRVEKEELCLQKQSESAADREQAIDDLKKEIAELRSAKVEAEKSLEKCTSEVKEASETSENTISGLRGEIRSLRNELEDSQVKVQEANLEVTASKASLRSQEESSREQQEQMGILQKTIEEQTEKLKSLEQELEQSHADRKKLTQEKLKVESKLSNAQTHNEHQQTAVQKLRRENAELQEKLSIYLEKDGDKGTALVIDELSQDSQRKSKDRVRELQQKVIQLNNEKQTLQNSYEESVKALEAVEKVYKMKEQATNKYKSDLEEALDKLQIREDEIEKAKEELSDTKEKLRRAGEKKEEREELKAKLKRAKETNKFQKTQIEDIQNDFKEQLHTAIMTQTRAKECDRKNQLLQLELTEIKDTLSIARNVITEKEGNMSSLKENMEAEQQKTAKLEQEAQLHVIVKERLELTEEDKKKLEKKLEATEKELETTQDNLRQANDTIKGLQKNTANLQEFNDKLKSDLEDCQNDVRNLKTSVTHKDKQLEAQLMRYIHARDENSQLCKELDDVWTSYQEDREWWRKRAEKYIGRRPKSAPPKRAGSRRDASGSFENSAQRRRLGKRLGNAQLNPTYINSRRTFAWSKEDQRAPEPEQNGAAERVDGTASQTPQLSPRPPSAPPARRERPSRPVSSYGVRSSPSPRSPNDDRLGGTDAWGLEQDSVSGCDDEELVARKAVRIGDRVMVQSGAFGEEKLNITGVVKFVGKIGGISAGRVYVGLKLDQPFGDSDGKLGSKELFKCAPRHGMMVRPGDISAVMNPRSQIYRSVNSLEYC